ncbi:hypothetical protein [Corynebacterium sp. UMB10321]|uniref:hypothetical protein n=1 Tax=Corynebacterium sp. UMB10321 TaxID=3046312 RepID=UPI00254E8FE2|nr:hypothetical protein [Corynebacterium sp. UMB10321]MDK8244118.1 hypothetical protein [Corynebacterium sp. UMB10321]
MESPLWDDFCENQGLTEFEDITDLSASGVLRNLMMHNTSTEVTFDCMKYSGGTTDAEGPFTDFTVYRVHSYPAQSEHIYFRDGEKIDHTGPEVRNNQLIHRAQHTSGCGWPTVLLYYQGYPEFWGHSFKTPPYAHYPRSFTRAGKPLEQGRYIRVVSYSDEEMQGLQMWKEAVIDTEFSMAVLFARHYGSEIDGVWTMLHIDERHDRRWPEHKIADYHWSF